jgi:hypothetical protein
MGRIAAPPDDDSVADYLRPLRMFLFACVCAFVRAREFFLFPRRPPPSLPLFSLCLFPHPGSDDRRLDGRAGCACSHAHSVSTNHKSRQIYPFYNRRPTQKTEERKREGVEREREREAGGRHAPPFFPLLFPFPKTKTPQNSPTVGAAGAHAGICGAPAWRFWEPQAAKSAENLCFSACPYLSRRRSLSAPRAHSRPAPAGAGVRRRPWPSAELRGTTDSVSPNPHDSNPPVFLQPSPSRRARRQRDEWRGAPTPPVARCVFSFFLPSSPSHPFKKGERGAHTRTGQGYEEPFPNDRR